MTDRLPVTVEGGEQVPLGERASATPRTRRDAGGASRVPPHSVAPETPHVARGSLSATFPAATGASLSGARDLQGTQHWMLQAITAKEPPPDVAAVLTAGPRLSAAERLDVYRVAYQARLVECLRDDYPAVADALDTVSGEDAFRELCEAYVAAHPSRSPNLNAFGRHLPAFVAAREALGDARGFLADLARLEWALVELVHAELPRPFELATLASTPPDRQAELRLVASPAVRLLRFAHPVNPWFQRYRGEGVVAPFPAPAPSAMVVYRQDLRLWRMALTPAMAHVLEALLAGAPLGEALGDLAAGATTDAEIGEAERTVTRWFTEWIRAGLFVDAVLPA